ncbi:hypothetical protein [Blastococcus sp. LR1]|uniref:hypothetical protein n=1 Tax=Blastococcus sp. LR1 TaxID=2877000 RepID=UPI001CCBD5EA|nr:hypothetical protein [Blastococcus sp. LR1]MCA0144663.1 hypothetical protein [Blastococcus sp. LR1]
MPAAADDPRTRTALAAHQMGALRWLGGGVIAVVLGILLGVAAVQVADSGGGRLPGAGVGTLALVLAGAAGIGVGAGALLRTRRWRQGLATTSWRTGTLRVAGPAVISFEPYDGEEVRLRLLSTAVWRTRAVQALDGATVQAAPVGGAQWVLTTEDAATVYGARTVPPGR